MTCLVFAFLVLGGVILVLIARPRNRPTHHRPGREVVHYGRQQQVVVTRPKKRKKPQVRQEPASGGGTLYTEAQVRAILEKALGAVWEAEQKSVRAQVKEQERRVAARLRQHQRESDFAELRGLHEKSRQTADLAFTMLGDARGAENTVSENIRNVHRAIKADQARGGSHVAAMRHTLDALHVDRDVLRTHRERYEQDVQRLNKETARLRDAIGANCGAPGRRWHEALMERTRRRKAERQRD
ncbi:hypothetical protein ACIA8K_34650 [Catenuloplanes sp. NPDC051500]|uniref:hypothetical protein n=1 Tax=Catenuloplanes sp. NPDC051500 TaxID=3363959 RepID=UPI0037B01ECF